MLTLADSAKDLMDNYFRTNGKQPMRVILAATCGGERLVVTLKPAEPGDEVFEIAGYTIAMDRDLLARAQPVAIHASPTGFIIQSSLKLAAGGCGSCKSCD
ncbi:MAG: IscA/HesB family protein [Thermodesulfobacteriota bacterium]